MRLLGNSRADTILYQLHGTDQAKTIADAALAQMQGHGIPPTPQNFVVWYHYISGQNRQLKQMLDTLISNKKKFTIKLNEELFEQFFGQTLEAKAVRNASERLQETMAQLVATLGDAGAETKSYGASLQSLSGQLANHGANDALQSAFQSIVAETSAMEARNSALEVQLQSSSEQIAKLEKNLENVRREAMTDVLTGISNRKFFEERLAACARAACETQEPMTLLIADIDHFKQFNDNWGHQFGDQVLRLVAKTLIDGVKGQDTAARFGGEEFAIILPRTGLSDAVKVADRIRNDVANRELVKRSTGETVGRITLSLGVALYTPGEPLEELIQRADVALYNAKRAGRNKVMAEVRLVRSSDEEGELVSRRN